MVMVIINLTKLTRIIVTYNTKSCLNDQICNKCQPWLLEQGIEAQREYTDSTNLNLYLNFFSLICCLSLFLSLHLSLTQPVNPCWDLAHTHWSSLQPKVGQKPSKDRAQRERQSEAGRQGQAGEGKWLKETDRWHEQGHGFTSFASLIPNII